MCWNEEEERKKKGKTWNNKYAGTIKYTQDQCTFRFNEGITKLLLYPYYYYYWLKESQEWRERRLYTIHDRGNNCRQFELIKWKAIGRFNNNNYYRDYAAFVENLHTRLYIYFQSQLTQFKFYFALAACLFLGSTLLYVAYICSNACVRALRVVFLSNLEN